MSPHAYTVLLILALRLEFQAHQATHGDTQRTGAWAVETNDRGSIPVTSDKGEKTVACV